MTKEKPNRAVRKYLDNATPEQKREFFSALLSRESRIKGQERRGISDVVIRRSRVCSLIVALLYAWAVGWSEELIRAAAILVLLGAIAWFPNEVAAATGRLGIGPAVSRPSHPWFLFVAAWIFWCLIGIVAILKLAGVQ
jgi:hypothetical protein